MPGQNKKLIAGVLELKAIGYSFNRIGELLHITGGHANVLHKRYTRFVKTGKLIVLQSKINKEG